MTASQHDLRLSAALVLLRTDLQILDPDLAVLASNLGLEMSSSEERLAMDDQLRRLISVLEQMREQLIPGAPITVEGQ